MLLFLKCYVFYGQVGLTVKRLTINMINYSILYIYTFRIHWWLKTLTGSGIYRYRYIDIWIYGHNIDIDIDRDPDKDIDMEWIWI